MYSQELEKAIMEHCGSLEYPSANGLDGGKSGWINKTAACNAALGNISKEVGPNNLYNVNDFCPSMNPDMPGPTLDDWDKV